LVNVFPDEAMLDDQCSRGNHGGNLGISKFFQQSPDISVQRFAPGFLPVVEISTDQANINALVHRRRIKRKQASFAVSCYSYFSFAEIFFKPVYGGHNLSNLKSDDVFSHMVGLSVQSFPVGLLTVLSFIKYGPVDQYRDEHLKTVFSQASGKLGA